MVCWNGQCLKLVMGIFRLVQPSYKRGRNKLLSCQSGSDVLFCLQLLCKTITATLHLGLRESMDHMCNYPILWIELIHK